MPAGYIPDAKFDDDAESTPKGGFIPGAKFDDGGPTKGDGKRHAFKAGMENAVSAVSTSLPKAIEKSGAFGLKLTPEEEADYAARERASAAKQEELLPGGPAGMADLKKRGLSALPQVVGENMAYSAPQIGATIVGGAAGAAAAPEAAVGAGVAGLAALAGGAIANTPIFAGQNAAAASEEGQKPLSEEGAQRSLLVAPAQAAGEAALGHFLPGVGKFIPGPKITGGIAARVAKGALGGAAEEAIVNPAQQVGTRYAQEKSLTDEEARGEYTDAAIIGGVTGAAVGGVGGTMRNDAKAKSKLDPDAGVRPVDTVDESGPVATNVLDRSAVRRNATTPGDQQEMFTRDEEGPVSKTLDPLTVLQKGIRPTETGSKPNQKSSKGALGATQLLPATAKQMADQLGIPFDLQRLREDPAYNESLGLEYLKTLLQKYNGDMFKAVMAYHAGPGNVDSWTSRFGDPNEVGQREWLEKVREVGYPESADYPLKVLKNLNRTSFDRTAPELAGLGKNFDPFSSGLDEQTEAAPGPTQGELALNEPSSQGDLFRPPSPDPVAGANREGPAETATSVASEGSQPDLFSTAPEAEAKSIAAGDFRMDRILQEVRAANKNDDGTIGKPDQFSVKLSSGLATSLTRGDVQAATKFVADEQAKLEGAALKGDTVDLRKRALDAAMHVIGEFQRAVVTQYAEAARTRQAQGTSTPAANVAIMGGERVPETNALPIGESKAAPTATVADNPNEVADESVRKQVETQRGSVLDFVLSDPETRNPTRRFLNELKKRGHKVGSLTEDEAERIAKFEEVREAFGKPDEIPSAPDESNDFGIRERGAPRVSERQSAKAQEQTSGQEVVREQPGGQESRQDDANEKGSADEGRSGQRDAQKEEVSPADARGQARQDAVAHSEHIGPTKRRWFLQGASAELGFTPEVKVPEGKTTRAAYDDGKAWAKARREQLEGNQTPPATPPQSATGGAAEKPAAPSRAMTKEGFVREVDKLLESKQITAHEAQLLRYGEDEAKTSDLYDGLDELMASKEQGPKAQRGDTPKVAGKSVDDIVKDMGKLENSLRQELDRLGLHDVAVNVLPGFQIAMEHKSTSVKGDYFRGLVRVAYEYDDTMQTLHHEAIHALRDLGLFTPAEWRTLMDEVKDTDLMKWANDHYPDLSYAGRIEEAIAEAYSKWAEGRPAPTGLRKMFLRMKKFFQALKRVFTKAGYATATDVFEAIESGEIGGRDRGTFRTPEAERPQARVDEKLKETAKDVGVTLRAASKNALNGMAMLTEVAEMAPPAMRPAATQFVKLQRAAGALGRKYEERIADIKRAYEKLPAVMHKEGGPLNKFLFDSTTSGKWGYAPSHLQGVKVDPDMAARFNALPKDTQDVVKAVFRHGYDNLMELRTSVNATINSNYDGLIADAKAAGEDTKRLETKKANALARYAKLTEAAEGLPYAPKKRDGRHVVVGMSKEMVAAKKANDTKRIAELEGDPDHYYVDFADTEGQAARAASNLSKDYDQTQHFPRETASQYLGGQESFLALERLRKAVDDETSGKPSNKAEADAQRKLRALAADLYLSTLAETSARKGEMRRANVMSGDRSKGGTLDMMKAFVTRGRATAHFIAALHTNGEILDKLEELKTLANDPSTKNRAERERTFNALATAYAQTTTTRPSRVADFLVRLTSTDLLTLSPSYHIQNFLQPEMFSVPMMAGKHGYARTQAAFAKAYADVGKIMGDAGVTERLNLKNLPSDVRDAVAELEARGTIDTGISNENGNWDVDEGGLIPNAAVPTWNAAARVLRLLPQNMETMNRVVTGMAAYRTEMVKGASHAEALDYAEKLILDTHGDYSAFNAPAFMKGGAWKRVVFQFKKFPIILSTLMAKQVHGSLKGATKEERLVARKALAFTLGHTAVVGGALGLPGAALVAPIINAVFDMFGDDDPDDPQLIIERALGGKSVLTDLLSKGIPYAMLNVDTSSKLGAGQMLNLFPFQDAPKLASGRDGALQFVGELTGPFMSGVVPGVGQSLKYAHDGDMYRAIENLLPNGISNIMKAGRLKTEGVTNSRGDTLISPDDISYADAFATLMGFQTKKLADQAHASSVAYETNQGFKDKAANIKRAYIRAKAKGEPVDDVIADWKELQASQTKNHMRPSPVSELFKADVSAKKNSRDVAGGVRFTKQNRGFVEELAGDQ